MRLRCEDDNEEPSGENKSSEEWGLGLEEESMMGDLLELVNLRKEEEEEKFNSMVSWWCF